MLEFISVLEFVSKFVGLMQSERDLVADEMGGVKKPQAQLLDDQLFQFLHGLLDQVTLNPPNRRTLFQFLRNPVAILLWDSRSVILDRGFYRGVGISSDSL